eukprot:Blabericola_migrator_1__11062@NODE_643_length_7105_cov_97_345553_g472_i0_p4_GENE_NODE_643_length_7105_cov_97_345553_g472_i0NODE_643_length_7105_cov_97_345553_g472_i0_p4_ORF_typecomplete_len234_score26_23_NODE_643_length_7105_cov_97_345553_g472_i0133834
MSPRNLVTLKNEDIMKPSDWRRIVVILPAVAMVHFTGSQMTDNDLDDKPRCLLNSRGFDESIPGVDGHGEDGDSVDVSGQESLDSVGALDQENGDLGRPTDEEINEFWLRHGFFSEDERSVGDDEVFLPTKEVTSEELSINSFLSAEDRNWIPTFSRENLALSIDESVVDSHASSEAEKLCSSKAFAPSDSLCFQAPVKATLIIVNLPLDTRQQRSRTLLMKLDLMRSRLTRF